MNKQLYLNLFLALTLIMLVALSLTSCVSSHSLYTPESTDNEIRLDRGTEYQVAKTSELEILATGLNSDEENDGIALGITNNSDNDIIIKDSQFTVYGGNISKNKWSVIETWDANSFYTSVQKKYESEIVANNIIGVLNVIDAAFGTTTTTTHRTSQGTTYTTTTTTYNPSDVALSILLTSAANQNIKQASKQTLDFLSQSLLFSSSIASGESYSGIIYFPSDRKYPDYKITFSNQDETVDFIFSRTDREEILHPWTTDSSRVLNAITINYSESVNKIAFNYFELLPHSNGVGLYTGIVFYDTAGDLQQNVDGYYYPSRGSGAKNNFSFYCDPDLTDSYSSYEYRGSFTEKELIQNAVAWPLGITYKIFKHTWLVGGMSLILVTDNYRIGTLEYSANGTAYKTHKENAIVKDSNTDNDFGFELQLGLNFVFYFLDINAFASYDIFMDRFIVDVGLGVAL